MPDFCGACGETFAERPALDAHQMETGHEMEQPDHPLRRTASTTREETPMVTKPPWSLNPGDRIDLHGHQQTVARIQHWNSGDIAVFTDYTGDDPWLIPPAQRITICPTSKEPT